MVGNVGPSAQVVKSLDRMGWKVPIVSHWGPAGGRFTELAGPSGKDVHFVQTYSFFGKQSPVGRTVIAALKAKYPDIKGAGRHHAGRRRRQRLRRACIWPRWRSQRPARPTATPIRQGFYKIDRYEGLIKTYVKPFSRRRARRAQARTTTCGRSSSTTASCRSPPRTENTERRAKMASRAAFLERQMLLMSALISGIGLGSMYGLMALGFYVTYAVSGTVNFAQGSSMMLGAVLTLRLRADAAAGRCRWRSCCALLLCALYGLLVEFVAVRPFVSRGSNAWLMATVALGIVLDNVVMFTFGKEPRSLPSPLAQSPLEIGGVGLGRLSAAAR